MFWLQRPLSTLYKLTSSNLLPVTLLSPHRFTPQQTERRVLCSLCRTYIHYNTIHSITIQYIPYSTLHSNAIQYIPMQYIPIHSNTIHTSLCCSTHFALLQALRFEQDHSDGVGASIAEKVLSVMGSVLLEASNSQTVIIRQTSMGGESTAPELARDEQSQLGQLLKHIETPFVVSLVTTM